MDAKDLIGPTQEKMYPEISAGNNIEKHHDFIVWPGIPPHIGAGVVWN